VSGLQGALANLFDAKPEAILLGVGGINHLPVITQCDIVDQEGHHHNGLVLLRDWLEEHDPFEFVEPGELESVFGVFRDRYAIKLSLFKETGILYGAGDRHVAEFLPGYLTDETGRGRRYGVHLTTADHRDQMFSERHKNVQNYVARKVRSHEQLAPVMAALLGGPAGEFVINVPNVGQIDNLPRDVVVECVAHIDPIGVRPLSVGNLPPAAFAVIAPHVARQELIVEAALTGNLSFAEVALSSDPLIRDPQTVTPLFEELVAANAASIE
jgi:alpha-galactosidase